MELEFDKEIDAILRRARGGGGVVSTAMGEHLDADVIAAFVENALPERSRRIYMSHLADCDRCRKILSANILASDHTAPAIVGAEIVEGAVASIPWYSRLFRAPGLAIAMGALVITLSGVLGYLVLRDRGTQNASVSQVTEQQQAPQAGGPYDIGTDSVAPSGAANSTSNANSATAANAMGLTSSNATPNALATPANGRVAETIASERQEALALSRNDKDLGVTGGTMEPSKTGAAAAAPPPAPVTSADAALGAGRDEKKAAPMDKVDAEREDMAKRKETDDLRSRRAEQPPPASKSGPARSGPLQNSSNQINTQNMGQMAVTRNVGGKVFENKNGAWYDRTYNGQATQNYTRGTAEYLKLEKGLRSIADNIGGTVVVVWKSRAYRIN